MTLIFISTMVKYYVRVGVIVEFVLTADYRLMANYTEAVDKKVVIMWCCKVFDH